MVGVEIAVGYVCAWLVGKARRVGGRVDAEVDRGLDAGVERVHQVVSRALGGDSALERAAEEAEGGEVSVRTRRRLADALEEALEHDGELAAALREALGGVAGAVVAHGDGVAVGGDVDVRAEGGSVAAVRVGDVTIGNPPVPGSPQG